MESVKMLRMITPKLALYYLLGFRLDVEAAVIKSLLNASGKSLEKKKLTWFIWFLIFS